MFWVNDLLKSYMWNIHATLLHLGEVSEHDTELEHLSLHRLLQEWRSHSRNMRETAMRNAFSMIINVSQWMNPWERKYSWRRSEGARTLPRSPTAFWAVAAFMLPPLYTADTTLPLSVSVSAVRKYSEERSELPTTLPRSATTFLSVAALMATEKKQILLSCISFFSLVLVTYLMLWFGVVWNDVIWMMWCDLMWCKVAWCGLKWIR